MRRALLRVRAWVAAFVAGAATGAGLLAGGALLLYTGRGLLGDVGVLAALVLATLAAGLWVGAPDPDAPPPSGAGRWTLAVLAFAGAGLYAGARTDGAFPLDPAGRGLAVLLFLAVPAYTAGLVFAAFAARTGPRRPMRQVAIVLLLGVAAGIAVSAAELIPNYDADVVLVGCATALALGAIIDPGLGALLRGSVSMRDKVVLITGVGGAGQVGYALAEAFLTSGARVAVTGRTDEIEARARELAEHGPVLGVVVDLTVAEQVDRLLEAVGERFGRLDVLVNAAGGLTLIRPLAETGPAEWQAEVMRNAETTFLVSRAALPLLRESRGSIVNFASPAGLRAVPGLGAYSAGKAAVVAMTRAMAVEERDHGVRVNAVAPGMIDTEQNRRAAAGNRSAAEVDEGSLAAGEPEPPRWVTRDEVANVVLFLAGEGSSGVSGEVVQVLGAGVE